MASTKTQASTIKISQNGNGVATNTAYINGKPYQIQKGETILSFIRRYHGHDQAGSRNHSKAENAIWKTYKIQTLNFVISFAPSRNR